MVFRGEQSLKDGLVGALSGAFSPGGGLLGRSPTWDGAEVHSDRRALELAETGPLSGTSASWAASLTNEKIMPLNLE